MPGSCLRFPSLQAYAREGKQLIRLRYGALLLLVITFHNIHVMKFTINVCVNASKKLLLNLRVFFNSDAILTITFVI